MRVLHETLERVIFPGLELFGIATALGRRCSTRVEVGDRRELEPMGRDAGSRGPCQRQRQSNTLYRMNGALPRFGRFARVAFELLAVCCRRGRL